MDADNNHGSTFIAIFVILIGIFGTITYIKMRDYPKGHECCRSLTDPNSNYCYYCDEYKFHEKIIYVWKYSPDPKDDGIDNWFNKN